MFHCVIHIMIDATFAVKLPALLIFAVTWIMWPSRVCVYNCLIVDELETAPHAHVCTIKCAEQPDT